jgi:hypothetical protein
MFRYAAFFVALLCFGDWKHHRPLSWWNLLPFAGLLLPVIGISLAISLKKSLYSRNSDFPV